MRSPERVRDYERQGGALTIYRTVAGVPVEISRQIPAVDPNSLVRRYQASLGQSNKNKSKPDNSTLDNLVVSVKTHQTVSALGPLIPAITPSTAILLLQNGMGSYESLCRTYWPDPALRPQFYVAITTHGVNSVGAPHQQHLSNFSFTHASPGYITIARVPSNPQLAETSDEALEKQQEEDASRQSPLVKALEHAPGLKARYVPYPEFLVTQVDKLVANAVINPLTALYECYNGELSALSSLDSLVYGLSRECADVFCAEYRDIIPAAELHASFNVARFADLVSSVIKATAENRSSMLQDVLALRDTEIDDICGHVVRLGYKHGKGVLHHKMMLDLVKSKVSLGRDRAKRSAPIVNI